MKRHNILQIKSVIFAILIAFIFTSAIPNPAVAAYNLRKIAFRQQIGDGVTSILEPILEELGEEACLRELDILFADGDLTPTELVWLKERYEEGKIKIDKFAGFLGRIVGTFEIFKQAHEADVKKLEKAIEEDAPKDEEFAKSYAAISTLAALAKAMQGMLHRSTGEMKMMAREEVEAKKPKVLVIDDEESVSNIIKFMLEKSGFEVVIVKNSDEGMPVFREDDFDLVITDMDTRKHGVGHADDGYKVGEKLKGKVPVILVAGQSGEIMSKAFGSGLFSALIKKPFRMNELLGPVNKVYTNFAREKKFKTAIPVLAYAPEARDPESRYIMATIMDAGIIAQSAPEAKFALAKLDEIAGKTNIRVLDISDVENVEDFFAKANLSQNDFPIVISRKDLEDESRATGNPVENKAELIPSIVNKILKALKLGHSLRTAEVHIVRMVKEIEERNSDFVWMLEFSNIDLNNIRYGAIVPSQDAERWREIAGALITILAYDTPEEGEYVSSAEAIVGLAETLFNEGTLPPHIIDMTRERLEEKDGFISLKTRSMDELGEELKSEYENSHKALQAV